MAKKEKKFALWIGLILLIIGTLVVFNNKASFWNYFGANNSLGILYVFLGSIGVYVGTKKEGVFYTKSIGITTIMLALLGFIPKINVPFVEILKINYLTNLFHLIIGIIAIYTYKKN